MYMIMLVIRNIKKYITQIKLQIENNIHTTSVNFMHSNIIKIIGFMLLVSILECGFFIYVLYNYKNHTQQQANIFLYNHPSKSSMKELCEIIGCYAILPNAIVKYDRTNALNFRIIFDNNEIEIKTNNTFGLLFDDDYRLIINQHNIPIILDMTSIYSYIKYTYCVSIILLSLFFIIFLVLSLKRERSIALKSLAGNEAILTNKSFILITENIHHELNTPLEVIDNKLEKIHSIIVEYLSRKNPNHDKRDIDIALGCLEEDFYFIKQSSEQIYSVLEKTRGFKHLRYSNGNKSIFDIIDGAFKIMSISNSNFTYNIDNRLNDYKLNYKLVKDFKNADLLNIVLNHIKNSLEANSNKIHIVFNSYGKYSLSFSIIDNGKGVKPHLIKQIFSPNFSTKSNFDNVIRGNGLYLNKSILNSSQGDVTLLDSTQYGATFKIKIMVLPK